MGVVFFSRDGVLEVFGGGFDGVGEVKVFLKGFLNWYWGIFIEDYIVFGEGLWVKSVYDWVFFGYVCCFWLKLEV